MTATFGINYDGFCLLFPLIQNTNKTYFFGKLKYVKVKNVQILYFVFSLKPN